MSLILKNYDRRLRAGSSGSASRAVFILTLAILA